LPYYLNLQSVPNTDDEAWIYQIDGSVKGNWYCRIKRMNTNGYFRKTLKTPNLLEALKRANRYWLQVRDAEEREIILVPGRGFRVLAVRWLAYRRARSNANSPDKSCDYMFHNYFIPYFGNESVDSITDKRYVAYLNDFRLLNPARKKPKIRTLAVEQQHLNSFLNWCYLNHHIRRPIRLSKLELHATKWIGHNADLVDYGSKTRTDLATYTVYKYFRDYFQYVNDWNHPFIKTEPFHYEVSRMRAAFYMKTLYNLCCRPGEELLKAKWKDLQIVESDEKDGAYYIKLSVTHGKKVRRNKFDGKDELIYFSDYGYIKMLADWKTYLISKGFPVDSDSYLFPLKKGRKDALGRRLRRRKNMPEEYYTFWESNNAGALIKRTREKVLAWRKSKGPVSKDLEEQILRFTWYSVRHVAIKRMITHSKYPIHFVAEKANTGVSMIEDFYMKYGTEPEGRIISRHPRIGEDKREITVFEADELSVLDDISKPIL